MVLSIFILKMASTGKGQTVYGILATPITIRKLRRQKVTPDNYRVYVGDSTLLTMATNNISIGIGHA